MTKCCPQNHSYKNIQWTIIPTIQTKIVKNWMFPHFWACNLVCSTSLLYHLIHILPHKLYYACNKESKCYSKPMNCLKKVSKLCDEATETQSSSINYAWQSKNWLWVNIVSDRYRTIVKIAENMARKCVYTSSLKRWSNKDNIQPIFMFQFFFCQTWCSRNCYQNPWQIH
jgi:hypothetical protein